MGVEQYKARQDTEGKEDSHKTHMLQDKCARRVVVKNTNLRRHRWFSRRFFHITQNTNQKMTFFVFVSFDMKNENHVK